MKMRCHLCYYDDLIHNLSPDIRGPVKNCSVYIFNDICNVRLFFMESERKRKTHSVSINTKCYVDSDERIIQIGSV
jgi:hypothetical protein